MKTLNQIIAAAVLVGSAGMAHADFALSGGLTPISGANTGSPIFPYYYGTQPTPFTGSSQVQFTLTGTADSSTLILDLGTVLEYPGGPSSGNIGSAINAGTDFSLTSFSISGGTATLGTSVPGNPLSVSILGAGTVDVLLNWTVAGGHFAGENNFDIAFSIDVNNNQTSVASAVDAYIGVTPVSVPEPSQAIAGITLLGCGGLVFLGRRFVMKKA